MAENSRDSPFMDGLSNARHFLGAVLEGERSSLSPLADSLRALIHAQLCATVHTDELQQLLDHLLCGHVANPSCLSPRAVQRVSLETASSRGAVMKFWGVRRSTPMNTPFVDALCNARHYLGTVLEREELSPVAHACREFILSQVSKTVHTDELSCLLNNLLTGTLTPPYLSASDAATVAFDSSSNTETVMEFWTDVKPPAAACVKNKLKIKSESTQLKVEPDDTMLLDDQDGFLTANEYSEEEDMEDDIEDGNHRIGEDNIEKDYMPPAKLKKADYEWELVEDEIKNEDEGTHVVRVKKTPARRGKKGPPPAIMPKNLTPNLEKKVDLDKTLICNVCGCGFALVCHLRVHMATHKDACPHGCGDCGRVFASAHALKIHMHVHTGDRKKNVRTGNRKPGSVECDVCGKWCLNNAQLKLHMYSHTGDYPYTCDVCGQGFAFASLLNQHMPRHTGERPFVCQVCGQAFTFSQVLRVHMRTHTGEKPYKCHICDHSFSQQIHLKVHINTHTGEKPYKCTVCGIGFANHANRNQHTTIHNRE